MTGAYEGTSLGEVWKIDSDRDYKVIIEESFSCLILGNRIQGHPRVEEDGRKKDNWGLRERELWSHCFAVSQRLLRSL